MDIYTREMHLKVEAELGDVVVAPRLVTRDS
jgi:hypothetical protein